ncbi:hypothetical protein AAFF_G00265970 [Aldrovandia affinis]|uniref:Uncharacterized protein n=1 Tax=Aldrovandia affinis TaxID=143900 RepID=A0AAD7W2K3_9TELE|nr:hypothetical protein AAFF_G00265970 [Aldrovandia affinis]
MSEDEHLSVSQLKAISLVTVSATYNRLCVKGAAGGGIELRAPVWAGGAELVMMPDVMLMLKQADLNHAPDVNECAPAGPAEPPQHRVTGGRASGVRPRRRLADTRAFKQDAAGTR